MKTIQHLTEEQLLQYAGGSLQSEYAQNVGNHLLNCAVCREGLAIPDQDRFLSLVFEENNEFDNAAIIRSTPAPESLFNPLTGLINNRPLMAWTSGALVLILSLSILLWINSIENRQSVGEVAASHESERTGIEINVVKETSYKEQQPATDLEKKAVSGHPDPTFKRGNLKGKQYEPKMNRKNVSQKQSITVKSDDTRQTPNSENLRTSRTRGGISDCRQEQNGSIKLGQNDEELVFYWSKIPGAQKYHLYVSDFDEVLIDEFESTDVTTYVMSKRLDATKTYYWKVLVTLENGETVVGKSEKFTVNDFHKKRTAIDGKNRTQIRCSAKN